MALRMLERLQYAAAHGDLPLVEEMLSAFRTAGVDPHVGWDPHVCVGGCRTALMVAAASGHGPVCKALLAAGANVNAVDDVGGTALTHAVRHGAPMSGSTSRDELVAILLAGGADPETRLRLANGDTLLIHAVKGVNATLSSVLLRHGAAVDAVDARGKSALMHAAELGHAGLCEMLLAGGASVRLKDNNDDTPLHCAMRGKSAECVQLLLQGGADLNCQNREEATPLMVGAWSAVPAEMCELLIDAGASLQSDDDYSWAVRMAANRGYEGIMRRALDAGLDPNAHESQSGTTLLVCAAMAGLERMCMLLLDYRADAIGEDGSNDLPLLAAARSGLVSVCKRLLELGAPVDVACQYGETPLLAAAKLHNVALCALLLQHGACVDGIRAHATPLHIAARNHDSELCALLLEHGADVNRCRSGWNSTALATCVQSWAQLREESAASRGTRSAPHERGTVTRQLAAGASTTAALLASRRIDFGMQANARALLNVDADALRAPLAARAWQRRGTAVRARHARC